MQTLVIYDITSDRIRDKVADRCKDAGLARIQYSAFLGELNHNRKEQLHQRLKRTLGKNEGNIILIPICDKDLSLALEIDAKRNSAASGE